MKNKKFNFKFIGKIDVLSIKNKVKNYTKEKWEEFDFRQKTFDVHKKTKTIPLIFDKDFRLDNPTYLEDSFSYQKEIKEINKFFTKECGKGFIIRAILVNLPANTFIGEHVDKGESLDKCMRCHIPIITNKSVLLVIIGIWHLMHIPIITNKSVLFKIEDEVKNLKPGEIWEINNTKKLHSVQNSGTEDRIHLIVDWMLDDVL